MKPEQVLELGQRLKSAVDAENEDVATETAFDLLIGLAFNIATLANRPGE